MRSVLSLIRGTHLRQNPDLQWVGRELAPKMVEDRQFIGNGMTDHDPNRRGFLFDGKIIEMRNRYLDDDRWAVSLRQTDLPMVEFVFPVKRGRPAGSHVMMANSQAESVVLDVANRLRSFGSHYLANPLEHFVYATPGEYVEWPSRDVIEPPRDPFYVPIAKIDEILKPLGDRISRMNVLHGPDQDARLAAEAELRQVMELRHHHMAKTTHGRWLVRHKEALDRYWQAVGDNMFHDPNAAEYAEAIETMRAAVEGEKSDPAP